MIACAQNTNTTTYFLLLHGNIQKKTKDIVLTTSTEQSIVVNATVGRIYKKVTDEKRTKTNKYNKIVNNFTKIHGKSTYFPKKYKLPKYKYTCTHIDIS